jgi:tyrosinase
MLRLRTSSRSKKWAFLEVEQLEERTLLSNSTLYVRKNEATLTDTEINNFVNAILTLKTTFNPGSTISIYDEFVQEHADAFSSGQAHGGPAFLAWHREFLLQFEQELQQVDSTVTIPYWDFTVDNSPTSSLWSKKFLGGNGDPTDNNIVKNGPFRQGQWTLVFDGPDLRRDFGDLVSSLPTADDVNAAFGASSYDVFPFDTGSPIDQSFRNNIEGFNHPTGESELHNRVHNWIGGSMAITYSPNDPVFWLLHADIDRLWAQWQAANPNDQYDPETGAAYGQNLYDPMSPFDVTPASVLDHQALGYIYDTELGNGGDGGGGNGGNGGGGAAPRAAPRASTASLASGHSAHTTAAASLTSSRGLPTDGTALLASLHGLHGDGTGAITFLGAFSGTVGVAGEHDDYSFKGMAAMNARDFSRLDDMASDSGHMVSAGGASMGVAHVCY